MLTPEEILNKKFDRVMVWGYDMNAVDSFLEAVEKDYTALYKENAALKGKLKVLISKIDEYRKVDESMRQTLLSAQSMADDIVAKAKKESAEYREHTVASCARELEDLTRRVATEEQRLEEAKTTAQVFIDRVLSLYANEEAHLTDLRNREFPGQPAPAPAPVTEAELFAPSAPEAPAEDAPVFEEPIVEEEPELVVEKPAPAEVKFEKPARVAPKDPQISAVDAVISEIDDISDKQPEDDSDELPDKVEIPSFNIPSFRREKAAEAKPEKAPAAKRHFDLPNFDFSKFKRDDQPKSDDKPSK